METLNPAEYKDKPVQEVLDALKSGLKGLSGDDANKRLKTFGFNEITEKKINPFIDFLKRFWGPMPWLLELAIILSLLLKHYLEGSLILTLLIINAIIGHLNARNSQKALELLKQKISIKAKVIRDGETKKIEAKEIVPGDIIIVALGDLVPADSKIIEGGVSVDESSLTGESLPIEKGVSDIIYSGSIMRRGEAKCVVVNTGINTYFGKTAELVKIAKPRSHQEQIMLTIIRYMMYLGTAASVLSLIIALWKHINIFTLLTLVLIFMMGSVPVALPAVLTILQAVSAMGLSKKGALVTRLESIEDASSIDVLCFDKTGTITQNKLFVVEVAPFANFTEEEVLRLSALASREELGDLIDIAIIEGAKAKSLTFDGYRQLSYTPFDPSIKRTEAMVEQNNSQFKIIKGALQIILSLIKTTNKDEIGMVNKKVEEFSRKGYRVLVVAKSKDGSSEFELVGALALSDPLRPESKETIEEAKRLGINPVILTGDNILIAKEIGRMVGVGDNIIRLPDIESLDKSKKMQIIEKCNGFAEIYPEDKYEIVKLFQSNKHMVGMTGDGVNDAPALKQAEMGIAVANASDVAKASASVVLTEPGIGVIINTVKISRQTYQRLLSWVINKIVKVVEITFFFTISFFLLKNIPITLLGMALLVFVNDFVTISLSKDNVEPTKNPNKWQLRDITIASLVVGAFFVLEDVLVTLLGLKYFNFTFENLQTFLLLNLVFNSQLRVLIVRERRHFWSSLPGREIILSSVITILTFILFAIKGILFKPLPAKNVLVLFLVAIIFACLVDFPKYYIFRKMKI